MCFCCKKSKHQKNSVTPISSISPFDSSFKKANKQCDESVLSHMNVNGQAGYIENKTDISKYLSNNEDNKNHLVKTIYQPDGPKIQNTTISGKLSKIDEENKKETMSQMSISINRELIESMNRLKNDFFGQKELISGFSSQSE